MPPTSRAPARNTTPATLDSPSAGDTTAATLNATSASLLGLLAIEDWPRPWTSYELAKQAGRSLHWFWPRAQRQLLAIPKRLVAHGYAVAHDHPTGKRAGTRYTITGAGRTALREWLDSTGGGIHLEAEELIRVFFADQSDVTQLRATLRRVAEQNALDATRLAAIVAGMGPQVEPDRSAVTALSIQLVADVQATIGAWATWALEETALWPDTHSSWEGATVVLRDVVEQDRARTRDGRMGE